MRISVIVTLVTILAVGSALAPREARAAFPGANGRIVFEGPEGSISTMAADGSDVRVVFPSTDTAFGRSPQWSPGGMMIVFEKVRTENRHSDIWRMNADGSRLVQLTHSGADRSPAWSADGSRIAFSSERTGDPEIYTVRIDGTGLRRLTTHAGEDRQPAWSPDNDRIAFASDRDLSEESRVSQIYSMRVDGSDVQPITAPIGPYVGGNNPDWSPDGTRIAYQSGDGDNLKIFEVNIASGVQRMLDLPPGDSHSASYAPDATTPVPDAIVYVEAKWPEFYGDIYIRSTAPGTTDAIPLTSTPDQPEWAPDWQPLPRFPLVDAPFSSFVAEIEWLYGAGITTGCSPGRFCPDSDVTRGQMASFLVRALKLPATTNDYFRDDGSSSHEADINALAAAGVTTGCGPARFCPTGTVSRAQMASFLARALDLPSTTTDHFRDDDSSTHEADINRLASAGITSGCSKDRYCPKQPVTRGQMAAFLFRALNAGD